MHMTKSLYGLWPSVVRNANNIIESLAFTSKTGSEFIDRVVRSLNSWVIPNPLGECAVGGY